MGIRNFRLAAMALLQLDWEDIKANIIDWGLAKALRYALEKLFTIDS